jgi:predicted acyl esterase
MGPVRNAAAMMESSGAMKAGSTQTTGVGGGGANVWPDIMEHPNFDEFWQSRNLRDHFHNVNCAVLSVGGWYELALDVKVIKCRFQSKRAQRYMRLQLFPSTLR